MSKQLKLLSQVQIPNEAELSQSSLFHGSIGNQPNRPNTHADIFINTAVTLRKIEGIGGSFSELGGKALLSLPKYKQTKVAENLFKDKLSFFRLPVGASDFALDAYSHSEVDNDFEMEHFSIKRDEKYILPYMNACKEQCENMRIHASPWSPPAWLKDTKQMGGGGSIIDKPEIYKAYALYVRRFIESYAEKGFDISRYAIQNEPDVDPKYPSCILPHKQMGEFIKYLHTELKQNNCSTEIWAGTFRSINGSSACDFVAENNDKLNLISGIGCQYSLTQQFVDLATMSPNLGLMHTESNCFHGENTWQQAIILYHSLVECYTAGCDTYTYWNMILNTTGESSWGWKQNSLITINEETHEVIYNPDYYVMSLAAKCVGTGGVRVAFSCASKRGLAIKGNDGVLRFIISNFTDEQASGIATIDGKEYDIALSARSISCFTLN